MDINNLKIQRKQIRRTFTQNCNEYETKDKVGNFENIDEKVTHLMALQDKANRLFDLDTQVSTKLLSNEDGVSPEELEEAFAKEFDSCETYRERWVGFKKLLDDLTTKHIDPLSLTDKSNSRCSLSLEPNQSLDRAKNLHLPKLTLKQFDGNVRNWLGFWGQFKKIHDDPNLELEDKFQYLIQATLPGSSARELVESYPPTGDNYTKAIDSLKTRFAREDMLVEVYVRDLLGLVLNKNSSTMFSLSSLHDKLTTQLNALDSLGVTPQKHGAILFPLVESALPEETLRAWERHRSTRKLESKSDINVTTLSVLLDFIKSEVESEERLNLARSGFAETSEKSTPKTQTQKSSYKSKVALSNPPTAATILTTNEKKREVVCLFCSKPHSTADCAAASDWSHDKKMDELKKSGGCFTCLKHGHSSKKCKSFVKCIVCKGRHHTMMCRNINKNDSFNTETNKSDNKTNIMLSQWNGQCFLQTLVVHLRTDAGTLVPVRALLDSGSQKSYISKRCISEHNPEKIGEEIVTHTLFGGVNIKNLKHNVYEIVLSNIQEKFECKIKVMDQDKICNFIPRFTDKSIIEALRKRNIVLTDTEYDLDVEILLGADVVSQLLTTEFKSVENGLVAVKTKLGWTIMGQTENTINRRFGIQMCATNLNSLDIPKLWKLDVLGITDPTENKAQQQLEKETLEHFNDNVKIQDDDRYSVKLPWKEGHPQLLENKDLSIKRLYATTKRLISIGKLEDYTNVFNDWKKSGIIEVIEESENDKPNTPQHYLPHHPVLKESSLTTKIRPVFDASAKDKNGNSLNDCLAKGPNLVEQIPSLIMKFRKFDFGVTSDITKAFLQIELQEKDREYLKFLWWKTNDCNEMITYRHCRVVFGLKSSPFLLGAVINHVLDNAPTHLQETANKLKSSFYVDNCITSVPTEEELKRFIEESKTLMSMGKFELRGWVCTGVSNNNPVDEESTPLLGLIWDSKRDTLSCDIASIRLSSTNVTKRVLLSLAQSIFDPIGFTSPSTLIPKLLLQETWKLKVGWDTTLPMSISKPFLHWMSQIHFLNQCSIPRKLSHFSLLVGDCSLHIFSDASKVAFSACIFLRVQLNNEISVQLVAAKSRIAPCKDITIPRLELLGAVIATRLYKQVESSLELNCKTHFWTDSTVALAWIKRKDTWNTFVANRCREIQENSNVEDWHHISGRDNPADLPSRGCSFECLSREKWWEGPNWLYTKEEEWKISSDEPLEEEIMKERKKTVVTAYNTNENRFLSQLENISKYPKIIRTIGWILRFAHNCQQRVQKRRNGLSGEEIKDAEVHLIQMMQKDKLTNFKEKSMKKLRIFEDVRGLLRVQSRLILSNDTSDFKYPILLPPCEIVKRLIYHYHLINNHAGVQILLHILREEYWILGGRKTVKSATSHCVQCKKQSSKPIEVPFAPLPHDRIKNCKVFEIIGIDLTGPLILKSKDKAWIVLYTCAVYRAVHLELIQSLSTDAFLQSLRRFIARRGRPLTVYTDNGTNFTGASNVFGKLDWEEITQQTSVQRICWKFNPPSAPWWGGWWERLIGCLKSLMRRTLGRSSLYYEELNTILCDCESVLNARPLTYVSNDCDDLIPLSPSSFLQSTLSNEVLEIDKVDEKSLNKRFRYLQRLRENLRARFRKEYLGMLVSYGKQTHKDIAIGDVVLVETENVKRITWPLAIVQKVLPGKDSVTRLVQVKTANGELLRPVQRVYPLEISSGTAENPISHECLKMKRESLKRGRRVK